MKINTPLFETWSLDTTTMRRKQSYSYKVGVGVVQDIRVVEGPRCFLSASDRNPFNPRPQNAKGWPTRTIFNEMLQPFFAAKVVSRNIRLNELASP